MTHVNKLWGHEEWIHNADYCMKKLVVRKGFQCSSHFHANKDETFLVTKGRVLFEHDDDVFMMLPGDSVHVPPKTIHRFSGIDDAEIVEASTHHDDADSYRLELSRPIHDDQEEYRNYLESEGIGLSTSELTGDF